MLAYLINNGSAGPSVRRTGTFGTTSNMLRRLLTTQAGIPRIIIRRSFSSTTPEAFIQPLKSDPDIACLFLNKPQTKNAISRRMLQVELAHYFLFLHHSDSFQELQDCLYTAKFDKRYTYPPDHDPWSQLIVQTASVCLLCGRPAQMPSVLVLTWRSDVPCR